MPQVEPKPQHRLKLLRELYKTVLNNTESFEEGAISADLAYLMGAVLSGSYCDWDAERPSCNCCAKIFRDGIPFGDLFTSNGCKATAHAAKR